MREMRNRNTAVKLKKWPLLALMVFVISLVILLTAALNDNSGAKEDEEVNPYMTTKTKIIMPTDEIGTDFTDVTSDVNPDTGEAEKPDFPNPGRFELNNNNNNLPNGYKRWEEPKFKDNDPGAPGERGIPVKILPEESKEIERSYNEYGFNQYVSDKISLHRSVPDIRPISCHYKSYQEKLPKVSVIIIFHNEGWSTLLRTVHSVLDRSPNELLEEIVLVDDFSEKEHLKKKLESYIKNYPKVKLVRTKQREGLIRARVNGADQSTGEVVLFLDSHCEANAGWLPPLLSEIAKNYRTVGCPIIDPIDHRTFRYEAGHGWTRGTFSWRFDYKERSISAEQYLSRKDEADPVASPVMAGGLFAISRKFWEELGKYDPELYVWGGEQYELSFKLWMCGGQMFNIPCSRVGHVYRDKVPYKSNKLNAALINFKRVAEVWMDDFKHLLYHYREDIAVQNHGDISERLSLRSRLECRNFEWYLANVANDTIRTRYEPIRSEGRIKNFASELCISFNDRSKKTKWPLVMSKCPAVGDESDQIIWTYILELRYGLTELCAEADDKQQQPNIYVEHCHETKGNQAFLYDEETNQIVHKDTNTCLQSPLNDSKENTLRLRRCNSKLLTQKWEMNMKDVNGPVPDWAKVADEFNKKRPIKNGQSRKILVK